MSGGLDARKAGIYVILPALMEGGNKLTVFFEFIGEASNDAGLYLGRVNHSTENYAALNFTDRYGFKVGDTNVPVQTVLTPVKGVHVLQYSAVGNKIEVYLDGVLLVPKNSIKSYIREHIVFALGPASKDNPSEKTGPFVFHELHYTMNDPGDSVRRSADAHIQEYTPDFSFSQWVSLGRGGFVLFDGEWTPGSEVIVMYGASKLMVRTAPPGGRMAILVRGYHNGVSITYLDGGSSPPLFKQGGITILVRLRISSFRKIFEYKAVTGELQY